jgi:DNA gyrase subunit A
LPVSDIRIQGRNTQGVKIMNVKGSDKVMAVARIMVEDSDIEKDNIL